MKKSVSGFTIVELVTVIAVIGILAAITIVAYNGIQNRAYDAAVKSDLRSAYAKIEVYVSQNGMKYPTDDEPFLNDAKIQVTKSAYRTDHLYNFVYCPPYPYNTSKDAAVIGSSKSGKLFVFSSLKGAYEYTGPHTMADYVDVCISATDKNGVFGTWGDYASDPYLWITSPGYMTSRSPQWLSWAAG